MMTYAGQRVHLIAPPGDPVVTRDALSVARLAIALLIAGVTCGCGSDVGTTGGPSGLVDGNRDSTLTSPIGKTMGEPNDAFPQAVVAVFDSQGIARLQGTVAARGDLDVFLLGPLSAGDRLIVDTDTSGSLLDVSVAIFDDNQKLVFANDDRGGTSDRFLDSFVDWVVRHDGDSYYLVVTDSAFADAGRGVGSYLLDAEVVGGSAVVPPTEQILLLDFDGAVLDSPILGTGTLPPFDAALISPVYRGQTQAIKETIRAVFEQNFERFNVTVLTTDDPPPPPGTDFSSVFFGGFDPGSFGLSESVDLYNAEFCDDAIIFTESFDPQIFLGVPTAVEMGIAMGNVGSHEAGHLLGLNHVDDDRALMDDASATDVFIDDQEFMEAPLSRDIMPIGTQDAVLLLWEIVGPRAGAQAHGITASAVERSRIVTGVDTPLPVKRGDAPIIRRRRSASQTKQE